LFRETHAFASSDCRSSSGVMPPNISALGPTKNAAVIHRRRFFLAKQSRCNHAEDGGEHDDRVERDERGALQVTAANPKLWFGFNGIHIAENPTTPPQSTQSTRLIPLQHRQVRLRRDVHAAGAGHALLALLLLLEQLHLSGPVAAGDVGHVLAVGLDAL